MNKRDRYDELDNLITTLDVLIDEITSKDLKEDLISLKSQYYDEREELEEEISAEDLKEAEKELKERNREYWNSQF